MTSEVLIMTPSAIAMAADSVVTIRGNKTYEGVNKLFMLSKNPPMGIMIYNNANFFTIPFETLIKDFRNKIKNKNIENINKLRECFFKYLENEIKKNNYPKLSLQDKINFFIENMKKELNNNNINKWIEKNNNIDIFEKYKNKIFMKKTILNKFNNDLNKIIPNSIENDKRNDCQKILKNLFVNFMILDNYTGIAIVGFENEKLFPSCTLFKIRYLYDDKFIFDDIENDEVGEKTVIFAPLAQTDVIESFLSHIDMNSENQLKMFFKNIMDCYNNQLKKLINSEKNISPENKEIIIKILNKLQNEHHKIDNSFEKFIEDIKHNNMNPILKSIQFLPKNELSNLAESLINLTSLKRKVQEGLETVGGDVDVAIITKGDGFIWTKRKHYFKAELNPHYFDN